MSEGLVPVSAVLVKRVLEALGARGVPVELVLERTGIPHEVMSDLELSISYEKMAQLWKVAEAMTGDRSFAVRFAEAMKTDGTYPCQYLMSTSATVGEGLVRLVRYVHRCIGGEALKLDVGPREARLVRRSSRPFGHDDEFVVTFVLLRSRQGAGVDWTPTHLTLQQDRQVGSDALLRVFRCPVTFGGEEIELRFPSEVLELSCAPADSRSGLLGLLSTYADDLRSAVPMRDSCIPAVASTIAKQMSRELPTISSTARLLRLTQRTLQRRLGREGISYSEVFDQVRCGLAVRFLGEPSLSVGQVAFILHFSEESAFVRAFKRWTGLTPGQYRRGSPLHARAPRRPSEVDTLLGPESGAAGLL